MAKFPIMENIYKRSSVNSVRDLHKEEEQDRREFQFWRETAKPVMVQPCIYRFIITRCLHSDVIHSFSVKQKQECRELLGEEERETRICFISELMSRISFGSLDSLICISRLADSSNIFSFPEAKVTRMFRHIKLNSQ